MSIKLDLEINEVSAILQVLGELPTKSNVYHLMKKIEDQAVPQVEEQQQNEVKSE